MSEAMAAQQDNPSVGRAPPWPQFAFRGAAGGLIVGSVIAGAEFLLHGRDLREVALPTYTLLYPLVGLGLGLLYCRYRRAGLRKGFSSVEFFSVEPLLPDAAAERDRRVRRVVGVGFGVGMAVALLATALDFAWRGWPFLTGMVVSSLISYPWLGLFLGYYFSLRQGDPRPSTRDLRLRTRTLMMIIAYIAILFGIATEATRYGGPAQRYH